MSIAKKLWITSSNRYRLASPFPENKKPYYWIHECRLLSGNTVFGSFARIFQSNNSIPGFGLYRLSRKIDYCGC